MGGHFIKSWSSTQPTITLSSGEAELHGVVRAAANGLGYLSLLSDLGIRLRLQLWTDSTASQGICARQGLGKVRHLDVQELWIQQRIRNQDFDLFKVLGEDNPSDLFTKHGLGNDRIASCICWVSWAATTEKGEQPQLHPCALKEAPRLFWPRA